MTSAGALDHVLSQVLNYPDDHQVRLALAYLGVDDIGALTMFRGDDFSLPYYIPNPEDPDNFVETRLVAVHSRRLAAIVDWYYEQPSQRLSTWFNLNAEIFQNWYDNTQKAPVIPPDVSTPDTSLTNAFRSKIKITIADYPKLKEDKQWRTYNRLLKATAASHDTLEVLDVSYTPTIAFQDVFQQKLYFMYNVFSQTLNTSKGKLCVRNHESTRDAQLVYKDLLAAYSDELSTTLTATTLRTELTLLKLDEKWRSGYEHFLNLWTTKIQDLESVTDSTIDDNTKRIWLTATLQSHPDMRAAIRQAQTTQLTLTGMDPVANPPSWSSFYNMILCTAKVLDKEKSETASTQRRNHRTETNRNQNNRSNNRNGRGNGQTTRSGRGHNNRNNTNNNSSNRQFTKYTGASMEMKADYSFSRADWPKLTKAQKETLIALKRSLRSSNTNNNSVPTTTNANRSVQVHATNPTPSSTSDEQSNVTTTSSAPSVRQLLSNSHVRGPTTSTSNPITITTQNGSYTVHKCIINYRVSRHETTPTLGSLMDGGANGGVSGSDVTVLDSTLDAVDITGLGDHSIDNVHLCTVAGLLQSQKGPIIGIFHQYANHGKGQTVHSINQMRHFGIIIDDTPRSFGGNQLIQTPDGYNIPISIRNGLPYMDMKAPTQDELDSYPHVMFTADTPWDPHVLDNENSLDDPDFITPPAGPSYHPDTINDFGEITTFDINQYLTTPAASTDTLMPPIKRKLFYTQVRPKQLDFLRLQPNFGYLPVDRIRHTLSNTTQFARMDTRYPLRKHYKTRFPAANIPRLNETVATDTLFADIPAHDDGILGHGGSTMVQLYCGCTSHITAVFPMKTDHEMASTFEDFIRSYGAPNALFNDNAKSQIGKAVAEILRMYAIKDFQCEPHHQHQNPAERQIQEVKKRCNVLMDRTGSPPQYWLLCTKYVVYLLNRVSLTSLQHRTPLEAATGQQPDISALLAFHWFQPVYFKNPKVSYPSNTQERSGRIVGIAEHQGDALTFLVLDDETHHVLARSELRPVDDINPNLRTPNPGNLALTEGETVPMAPTKTIMSSTDIAGLNIEPTRLKLPKFSPDELLGQTFIQQDDDGINYSAKVVKRINDKDSANHQNIKFLVEIGEGKYEEILTYNEISNLIEEQESTDDGDRRWTFTDILEHQGPINQNHHDYKGSAYNVLVKWSDGSETYEPLDIMIKDDPIFMARYAVDNNLLNTPSWKRLKRFVCPRPLMNRLINKTRRKPIAPKYQFGIQVPRNVKEAYALDAKNGNTKWQMLCRKKSIHLLTTTPSKTKVRSNSLSIINASLSTSSSPSNMTSVIKHASSLVVTSRILTPKEPILESYHFAASALPPLPLKSTILKSWLEIYHLPTLKPIPKKKFTSLPALNLVH